MLIGRFRLQNETLVNGIQDMNQKIINQGVLKKMVVKEYFPKYVGNPHIYLVSQSNCSIVAHAVGASHYSMYKCINILEITHVKL